MSFVGEMAKVFGKLAPYPNLAAWLTRMHARPAFKRSVEKDGVPGWRDSYLDVSAG
jgi:glutathione S-transferase